MKNSIIKRAAVGSSRKQLNQCVIASEERAKQSPQSNFALNRGLLRKWQRALPAHFLAMTTLILSFLFSTNSSAQTVPILTFDSFEKYLHPTSDTVYVINFWATWCKPCVEELPAFEKLNENYKGKKVKVLLVSIDFRSQYKKKVMPFVQKNKLKSEVMLLDAEGNNDFIDKVNAAWQGTIPATNIIQSNSNTNQFFEKQFTFEELENLVKPLIKL